MIPEPVAQSIPITFRLRRRFTAPRQNVFRAWTDPEVLKRWWCPHGWAPAEIEVDLRVGGAYRIGMRRIGMRRGEGGPPMYVYGSFLEVQTPEKLVYTWHWENAFEHMPKTRVTVEFVESGGATEVVLIHEHLPEIGVCLRHRSGWMAAWERLERSLTA